MLRIRTKSAQIKPFSLNEAQQLVLRKLTEQRRNEGRVRVLILKARQLGMSTLVAGRFFRRCHLTPNQHAVVIADKKDRAAQLFSIYDRFDKNLPPDLKVEKRADARGKHLIYDTRTGGLGSELHVETAGDVAAGRGSTIQLLHISELAFWPNAEEVWVSLQQAVPDSDSEVIVESTANGVGGLFYELWQQSIEGESGFLPIFLPWWIHKPYTAEVTFEERISIEESVDPFEREAQDVGFEFEGQVFRLEPEQLQWRRQTIRDKLRGDARSFRQEYPTTAREAFITSGAGYFDEEALRRYELTARTIAPKMRGDLIESGGGILMRPQAHGYVTVWAYPSRLGRYVVFADAAEGKMVAQSGSFGDPESERGGRDFSSAHVYDIDSRTYVAAIHGRMAPEVFAEYLDRIGYFYSSPGRADQGSTRVPAFLGVERNGSGETVLRVLKDERHYPQLFYRRTINRRTNRTTTELGWRTTSESRMPLLDDLAAAIRQESVKLPDSASIGEMFTFVRGEDGKPEAQSGAHDDRVISLAGCIQMARYAPAPVSAPLLEEEQLFAGATSPTGWAES